MNMTTLELYLATITLAFALNCWTLALWRRDTQRLRAELADLRAELADLRAELADLRANSHRRDPRTGRLRPLGK
jgi:cell division protein FtsB